jgi:hypothetical protein
MSSSNRLIELNKIDDYLQGGKVDNKESVREDVMQSYFNTVQQKTPDTKQLIPMSNKKNRTLREKPGSHMSLINLSEGPVKRYGGSEYKNTRENFKYPDYQAKVSEQENARIPEYNFKSKPIKVELIESPTK